MYKSFRNVIILAQIPWEAALTQMTGYPQHVSVSSGQNKQLHRKYPAEKSGFRSF